MRRYLYKGTASLSSSLYFQTSFRAHRKSCTASFSEMDSTAVPCSECVIYGDTLGLEVKSVVTKTMLTIDAESTIDLLRLLNEYLYDATAGCCILKQYELENIILSQFDDILTHILTNSHQEILEFYTHPGNENVYIGFFGTLKELILDIQYLVTAESRFKDNPHFRITDDPKPRALRKMTLLLYRAAVCYEAANSVHKFEDTGFYGLPVRDFTWHRHFLNKAIEFMHDPTYDETNCPVCSSEHDENTNYAIFDSCPHSICASCAENLFCFTEPTTRKCPLCRSHVKEWTTSHILLISRHLLSS